MAEPMRPSPINPTFMTILLAKRRAASNQLPAHPFELAANVIDDVALLEVVRQHVPGIGLDFEMARQRLCFMETQAVFDGKARGAELPEIVEEDRHVDVGPPFPRPRILFEDDNGVVHVEELRQLAVLLLNRL